MLGINQKKQAELFAELHQSNEMLIIPNVWDAGSAVVFEKQAFKAVATTSAGIAYTLGYPDGEDISLSDLCLAVSQICKRISIPLSVDFERGYGSSIEEIKENVKQIILAGAVGINIEDGLANGKLANLNYQIQLIEAIAQLKKEMDIPFVINARTCTYWLNVADEECKQSITIERGNAFRKVGADCIFIPGLLDETTVVKFVKQINAPLNLIVNSEFNDFDSLGKIGVKRLSMGSGAVRSVFNHLINIAADYKKGKLDLLINQPLSYAEANKLFTLG